MTSQQMINWLESKGFTIKRQEGSHVLLKNPVHASVVVVPASSRKKLNPSAVLSIKRHVVEKGITTEQEFATAFHE